MNCGIDKKKRWLFCSCPDIPVSFQILLKIQEDTGCRKYRYRKIQLRSVGVTPIWGVNGNLFSTMLAIHWFAPFKSHHHREGP